MVYGQNIKNDLMVLIPQKIITEYVINKVCVGKHYSLRLACCAGCKEEDTAVLASGLVCKTGSCISLTDCRYTVLIIYILDTNEFLNTGIVLFKIRYL